MPRQRISVAAELSRNSSLLVAAAGNETFLCTSLSRDILSFLHTKREMNMDSNAGGMGILGLLIPVAILVLLIVSMWKVFTKAGQPGWAAIVPIYNIVVLLKIVGKPVWWIVGFLIPIVNIIVAILLSLALAKVFGKGTGFAIGLILLGIVFIPILAFSDAQYTAPPPAD